MEGLVGLVIVAVLVAFLGPALKEMIIRSRTTRCLANMKVLHTAFMLHIGDRNGILLRYREGEFSDDGVWQNTGPFWREQLFPYLQGYRKTPNAYLDCPAETVLKREDWHYGMNALVSEDRTTAERLQNIALPSRRFLLGDSNKESRIGRVVANDCAFRHGQDRANFLFFDGHVESRDYRQIPIPDNGFSKTSPEYRAWWLGAD